MGLPRGRAAEVNVAGKRLPQYSDASACGTGAGSKDLGEPRKMALREMVALVSRLRGHRTLRARIQRVLVRFEDVCDLA